MNPFEIDDLRRLIFSFLRKKPHKQCSECLHVLEWDPGKQFKKYVEWGAGVRASQNLVRAARAHALLKGDSVVSKEHVRYVAPSVLRHRIIVNFIGEAEQWTPIRLIELLLENHT